MNKQEHNALQLCVDALDQLLPYLAKVPADVGLLNSALMAARPLLKQEPAPAQGEREAKAWPALAGIGRDSGHPRAVVLYLRHEPSDEHLRMIQEALRTRPAQTEQQPSTDALINGAKALLALDESGSLAPHGIGGLAREVIEKLIVRVEQTAPQPED